MLSTPPILAQKHYQAPSVFTARNLLREARRQKSLPEATIPPVCVLDPDGDIVRYLLATGQAAVDPHWACYHTTLYTFTVGDQRLGIIGCAVGASFAVLLAEELFASGCTLLISITSSGQITPLGEPPYYILIDRALRDEGASYHYLPPSDFSTLAPALRQRVETALHGSALTLYTGATWTTDAPFRETAAAIAHAQSLGILAVEMEAAALYAFAETQGAAVVCFAHVTNQMAQKDGDFEKGAGNGSHDALRLIACVAGVNLSD
ncbi:MAG: uridine phosphorylase [Caldilinea sp. CFX5]|nr:uridine phosphorylase [Caldilinea sp. CFX5]